MVALWNRPGHYIFVQWFLLLSIYLLLFLGYSYPSQIGCLPYFDTWCGLSANLGCRSEICCTRLAGNAGHKKSPKIRHLHTIAQLCQTISSQLRHIFTIGKNLLNSSISSIRSHNMVNFSPLTAEIFCQLWSSPANFNEFRVLAVLLHGTLVVGVSQTVALNRGRHLYPAGWPSRLALAYILVLFVI